MFNNIGLPGLLLIAVVVLVLFGRGKISSLMGEVGKGITAFKRGVSDGSKEIEDAATDEAQDVTPAIENKTEMASDSLKPAPKSAAKTTPKPAKKDKV